MKVKDLCQIFKNNLAIKRLGRKCDLKTFSFPAVTLNLQLPSFRFCFNIPAEEQAKRTPQAGFSEMEELIDNNRVRAG